MERRILSVLVISSIIMVVGGCAKQGKVKGDEAVTAEVNISGQQRTAAATTAEPVSRAKEPETVSLSEVKPASTVQKITLEPISGAGELKAMLDTVYFAFDSYSLSQKAMDSLAKNAEILKHEPTMKVRIEGHSDERGSDEYNLALGERRAQSARKYLVTMGVPPQRLSLISYGEEKPVAAGHDEASWALNRRDNFVIASP